MSDQISRRSFIIKGTTIALSTGILLKTGWGSPLLEGSRSKVTEVFHPSVVGDNRKIDQDKVREMLNKGLVKLTGRSEHPILQYVNPNDRIGLKINCLGRPELYTHKELIRALIGELKDAGVKENKIIVWDRFWHHMESCGFTLNTSGDGVRYMATERMPDSTELHDPEYLYRSESDNPERRSEDGAISKFSKIFTQECDKIINMAILKDHGLAGVTLCLKNISYGVCNNNSRFHGPEHIGNFISDFYALPEIREKIVLNLVDGLEGCFENGPVPKNPEVFFSPQKIWLGEDPVALDTIGTQVIEEKRAEKAYPAIRDIRPGLNHIRFAADAGIGIDDPDRIDLTRIELSS